MPEAVDRPKWYAIGEAYVQKNSTENSFFKNTSVPIQFTIRIGANKLN